MWITFFWWNELVDIFLYPKSKKWIKDTFTSQG